jgi:hypothetical protein
MIVFFDPTPISQNPDRFRVTFTASGDKDVLTAGKTNWIEVPDAEIAALEAWVVEGGALVLADLWPYKRALIALVNRRIGEIRLNYITDMPGQDMVYQAKEAEAKEFLAQSPVPTDLTPYPFISEEIGITGADAYEIAQIWVTLSAQWRQVAAGLENIRLEAVKVIEQSTDLVEIQSIETAFIAQTSNL